MVVEAQDILEDLDLDLAHQVEELVLTTAGHLGLASADVAEMECTVLQAVAEADMERVRKYIERNANTMKGKK